MERQSALILSIVCFILFTIILYKGVKLKIFPTIVISSFLSVVLLFIFYPPSMLADDTADFTLVLYALIQIITLILIIVYVLYKGIMDVRC